MDDLLDIAAALDVDVAQLMPTPTRRPVGAVLRAIAEEIDYPVLADALERFVEEVDAMPVPKAAYTVTTINARDAAEVLLAQAGITEPSVDVLTLVRGCGVRVLEWDFQDEIDGLMVILPDGPAIGLDDSKIDVRKRFTLAHELGHYILRHSSTFHVDYRDGGGTHGDAPTYNWRHERTANEFAANLLMPAEILRRIHTPTTAVASLAKQFNVSKQAMAFRLATLGLRELPTQ